MAAAVRPSSEPPRHHERLTAPTEDRKLLEVRTTLVEDSGVVGSRGTRRVSRSLAAAAAALVLASALPSVLNGGPSGAMSAYGGGVLHASITGRYSASATTTAPNGTTETQTSMISWSATVTGTENDILQAKALPKLTSLTGTVSVTGAAEPNCSGGLSATTQNVFQGDYQSLLVVYPPGYPAITAPGTGPQNNIGSKQYLVEATIPIKFVESSVGNDPNSGCSNMFAQDYLNFGPMQGDPQYNAWQKTRHSWAYFDANGHSPAPSITANVIGAGYQSQGQVMLTFGAGRGGSSTSSSGSSSATSGCPSAPTITVNPNNVKANNSTTVRGCNFKHHSRVALVECLETSWIAPRKPCDTDNSVTVTTNSSGGFRTTMKVDACRGAAPAGITEDCYFGVVKPTGVDTIALQPYATIALSP